MVRQIDPYKLVMYLIEGLFEMIWSSLLNDDKGSL